MRIANYLKVRVFFLNGASWTSLNSSASWTLIYSNCWCWCDNLRFFFIFFLNSIRIKQNLRFTSITKAAVSLNASLNKKNKYIKKSGCLNFKLDAPRFTRVAERCALCYLILRFIFYSSEREVGKNNQNEKRVARQCSLVVTSRASQASQENFKPRNRRFIIPGVQLWYTFRALTLVMEKKTKTKKKGTSNLLPVARHAKVRRVLFYIINISLFVRSGRQVLLERGALCEPSVGSLNLRALKKEICLQ